MIIETDMETNVNYYCILIHYLSRRIMNGKKICAREKYWKVNNTYQLKYIIIIIGNPKSEGFPRTE